VITKKNGSKVIDLAAIKIGFLKNDQIKHAHQSMSKQVFSNTAASLKLEYFRLF
jgi:hypothetical protein